MELAPGYDSEGRPRPGLPVRSVVGLFVCAVLLAGCLTLLFLAMREVMELGGMVASGGPYAIEHPAPNWVWVFPVSIITGLISAFAFYAFHSRTGGLPLHLLAWPALFTSLGYNFLDFGFDPPGDGGFAWGWLVCGVLFMVMGLGPLALATPAILKKLKNPQASSSRRPVSPTVLCLAGAALGVLGGVAAFRALS